MKTIALLAASNVFMTTAWYGHLRFRESALWKVILVSWLLAFFEYCLQVPANRIGYGQFTAAQLKIIQGVITLLVFVAFAWLYLGERLRIDRWQVRLLMAETPSFIISHRWPLERAREAYQMWNDKDDDCTKIVLDPRPAIGKDPGSDW